MIAFNNDNSDVPPLIEKISPQQEIEIYQVSLYLPKSVKQDNKLLSAWLSKQMSLAEKEILELIASRPNKKIAT